MRQHRATSILSGIAVLGQPTRACPSYPDLDSPVPEEPSPDRTHGSRGTQVRALSGMSPVASTSSYNAACLTESKSITSYNWQTQSIGTQSVVRGFEWFMPFSSESPQFAPLPVPEPICRVTARGAPKSASAPCPGLGDGSPSRFDISPASVNDLPARINSPFSISTPHRAALASSYPIADALVMTPLRRVSFAYSPTHSVHRSECSVQPYSEVYGMHPRQFDLDGSGNRLLRGPVFPVFPRQNGGQPLSEALFS